MYIVFLRDRGMDDYIPQNPNFKKVRAHFKWYSFEEQVNFLFLLLRQNLDILYIPHFNIPILYPGKLVTAIPDIIMHTYSTEKGTTLPKPYFRFKKWVYKMVVLWATFRSKKVIVPSNDTLNDFRKVYPFISKQKYVLAPEGVDPELLTQTTGEPTEVLAKHGIEKPFLLYISSFYEHKNVPALLGAFKILTEQYNFTGQLVLIGKKDKFSEEIEKQIKEKGLYGRVLMPGSTSYVTDTDTVVLRKEAEVYVFPSLKEGFSLTPMEAQAFSLAAVISDIPCHREIYGDSVLYFDPHNPHEIAERINQVLLDTNLKQQLIEKGSELINKYNWNETARITKEVFNEV